MYSLESNIRAIQNELEKNRYRDEPCAKLIAVTKNQSAEVVNHLLNCNIMDIAENKVQVFMEKKEKIEKKYKLHWIGRLQSNKVKYIIDNVCMLHTLDRLSLAQEVNRRAGEIDRVLPTLIQVNVSGETQKAGLSPSELRDFLLKIKDFSHIQVKGLMSMMPLNASEEELFSLFTQTRTMFDQLKQEAMPCIDMCELSMGMSNDYKIAACCGATMVRIGTALFSS